MDCSPPRFRESSAAMYDSQCYPQQCQNQNNFGAPPPMFLPVNPAYPGLKLVSNNPPMYAVENFLTPLECSTLMTSSDSSLRTSSVVGDGDGVVSPIRTSTSCYFAREDLPFLCNKVCTLLGIPTANLELPQVSRYLQTNFYAPHFDAFDLNTEDGRRFLQNGGQRIGTVLIYLNDVAQGGSTSFPTLNLSVRPQQGMALIFFPATLDGQLDTRALHSADPAIDIKYVSQVWIRQAPYTGVPTLRLSQPLVSGYATNQGPMW